jgi:HK97 family phage major capsid protein
MLRQLVLTRKLAGLNSQLEGLRAKDAAFETRATALKTREAELETAINEITDQSTQEEKDAVDAAVAEHEAAEQALSDEKAANDTEKQRLEDEIAKIEAELAEINGRAKDLPKADPKPEARKDEHNMDTRVKFLGMGREARDAFFARDDVKGFLGEIRAIKTRGVTNGSLTIPDVVLELLRDNLEQFSKLARFVTVKRVNGTARQNILGAAPEGVWMEATGALNELDMSLNQIEVDGYMVGGIIWVHNTLLEDSDIALGSEIMSQLGAAIGKAVDRAILFGTGTKTPVGIATRLAQTSAPSNWGTYAPAWTDLHTSNVLKLNIDGTTGATFYASLIAALGVAKPNYTDGRAFWVMNRKTHIKLMTKALAFDAAAALLAGVNNQMPIIGGEIVELELMGDNTIIGGYGSAYLLAERAGAQIESSEHAKFQQLMTGFRGYARYDGMPVFGEAFVIVNFANADAATTSTFETDYANTDLGVLSVTAAASASAIGKTVLTVTGAEASGTTLKYKIGDYVVTRGQKPVGYTALTSGTTEIAAAAGTTITVVELDGSGRVIKAGKVIAVPKTA